MKRFVSFSSVPKKTLSLSVPAELVDEFRNQAKNEFCMKPAEFMTYVLCDMQGKDPMRYGLIPLNDAEGLALGEVD